MALIPGTRLGVYEVTAQIGEGGMGQVYRARDTTLNRDVALKILPDAFASDPDRLTRFTREAQTLAALNHPNIAAIYGIEESGRVRALVMELVEGEDLSQRIACGAVPINEALPIAKQIAEALEAAHEQGIIHRDLKPANIKVRSDGTVKVLDFGLAKAMEPAVGSNESQSLTITTPAMMTGLGVILGTAAYMSPEQARGRVVDKRSDVWAFGCVLYEMLSGRRAFDGQDVTDTIAAVVRGEPDWDALPSDVTAQIRLLLTRCLEKDRKARISDIAVARFLMTESMPGRVADVPAVPSPPPRPLRTRGAPVAAAAVVAAIVGAAAWTLKPPPPVPPLVVSRFSVPLGDGQTFTANNGLSVAISPDGSKVAYAANNQLYLRSLSELEARPIAGTHDPITPSFPVFSPDSQSIAFFAEGALKKIAVSGGAALTICPVTARPAGISWDADGIVFGQTKGILRVSENGGQPTMIAGVKDGEFAYGPQMLSGGDRVLFTVATSATADGWDKAQIVVQSLRTGERKTLITGGSDGRYLPTGHLLYALGGVLFAVPFDPHALAVNGGAVPVLEGVKRSSNGNLGTTHLSVSRTGTLVFVPGSALTSGHFDLALFPRGGTGQPQPMKLTPRPYQYPRLSPNGRQIAVGTDDGKDAIVWIYAVSAASQIRQLTLGGRNRVPVWSSDSEHVAFQSDRAGDLAIFWQRADGTTPAERLTTPDTDTAHVPESWSPDGKTLLFTVMKGSRYTLAALSLSDKKVTTLAGIEAVQPLSAAFSPDGRWVAYSMAASETGAGPLNVQPFPPSGSPYQIAKNGGHPMWTSDGKELLYTPGPTQLVAISVATRPSFTFGNPVPVRIPRFIDRGPQSERNSDITLDGQRLLGVVEAEQAGAPGAATPQMRVVLNWFEELKARVPTK